MTCRCAPIPNLQPLYFAECRYGRLGNEFQATDRDKNSREVIVDQIRSREIDVVKVLEIDEQTGSCRDVTEELIKAAEQERIQRDPPTLEESLERLRGMLIDHERDLKRDGLYGWTS